MPRAHQYDDFMRDERRRELQRAYNTKRKKRFGRQRISKFARAQFVAIDGEGWDADEVHEVGYDDELKAPHYVYSEHAYTLLAAYDGRSGNHYELYEGGNRLGLEACLDFLLDVSSRYRNGILVCYGASYDINQIFYDLSRDECRAICEATAKDDAIIDRGGKRYLINYRPRKCLKVSRYDNGRHYDAVTKKKIRPDASFTLWDVIGFFQCAFVKTCADWLGQDNVALKFLSEWKAKRSQFATESIDDIILYNRAENEALVDVMQRLVTAMRHPDVDITLNRWDGAGAVAAALYKKHGMKDYMNDTETNSPAVFAAARGAYSGGHIESFKIGYESRPIYHYDIRSAYPSFIRNLPRLDAGRWRHGRSAHPPPGFTIVRTKWTFPMGCPFYPLFYRTRTGTILYPQHGHGWHWYPEWSVAKRFHTELRGAGNDAGFFDVKEWWSWEGISEEKPFAWVERLYNRRAELKRSCEGGAAQIVIKLGLNSLYGKMAQQVGYRIDEDGDLRKPPYFQLEWAGFVTASARAMVMEAALQQPDDVVSIATDGIYSLAPLYLNTSEALGDWEASTHSALCIVMPGFYMHEDDGKKWRTYSRGFDKEGTISETRFYRDQWSRGVTSIPIQQRRLIGLKQALTSEKLWPMRGSWVTSNRRLALDGGNSKRDPLKGNQRPYIRLCRTEPRLNEDYPALSKPHALDWKDKASDLGEWEVDDDFED